MTRNQSNGTDTSGRPWAKKSEVVKGSILKSDGGFTCMADGARHQVCRDGDHLYIRCGVGRHYLNGQLAHGKDGDYYIGLYLVGSP